MRRRLTKRYRHKILVEIMIGQPPLLDARDKYIICGTKVPRIDILAMGT